MTFVTRTARSCGIVKFRGFIRGSGRNYPHMSLAKWLIGSRSFTAKTVKTDVFDSAGQFPAKARLLRRNNRREEFYVHIRANSYQRHPGDTGKTPYRRIDL
ncbi:MAG TPA: hypothetical protein VHQ01_09305 [Pyrinomonadaceae bacterium]|nr:hypothetical protein [Pyrinomonadaceae bacterium]